MSDKEIILRKIDRLILTTNWWRKRSVDEMFAGIYGERLVVDETKGMVYARSLWHLRKMENKKNVGFLGYNKLTLKLWW